MSKLDYTEFDNELIKQIRCGNDTASKLEDSSLYALAMPFCSKNSSSFRVIDRRLQALRRAGKIVFTRSGWQVV